MKINKHITITLSENDVQSIIANWAESEGYDVAPADVTFSVENRCEGYGLNEHYVPRFKNCTIDVKGEK